MTNSRRKGVEGERQWVYKLREHGFEARRGQQFRGGPDSPDVICEDLPEFHFEVKYSSRLSLYEALSQAASEAPPGAVPVVAHRRVKSGKREGNPWVVCLAADDFLDLVMDLPPKDSKLKKLEEESAR